MFSIQSIFESKAQAINKKDVINVSEGFNLFYRICYQFDANLGVLQISKTYKKLRPPLIPGQTPMRSTIDTNNILFERTCMSYLFPEKLPASQQHSHVLFLTRKTFFCINNKPKFLLRNFNIFDTKKKNSFINEI
jgi:hypothetical protein